MVNPDRKIREISNKMNGFKKELRDGRTRGERGRPLTDDEKQNVSPEKLRECEEALEQRKEALSHTLSHT